MYASSAGLYTFRTSKGNTYIWSCIMKNYLHIQHVFWYVAVNKIG